MPLEAGGNEKTSYDGYKKTNMLCSVYTRCANELGEKACQTRFWKRLYDMSEALSKKAALKDSWSVIGIAVHIVKSREMYSVQIECSHCGRCSDAMTIADGWDDMIEKVNAICVTLFCNNTSSSNLPESVLKQSGAGLWSGRGDEWGAGWTRSSDLFSESQALVPAPYNCHHENLRKQQTIRQWEDYGGDEEKDWGKDVHKDWGGSWSYGEKVYWGGGGGVPAAGAGVFGSAHTSKSWSHDEKNDWGGGVDRGLGSDVDGGWDSSWSHGEKGGWGGDGGVPAAGADDFSRAHPSTSWSNDEKNEWRSDEKKDRSNDEKKDWRSSDSKWFAGIW
jgi:hypothetical protein